MHDNEPQFQGLQKTLLCRGVAPACVERMLDELRDHYMDLLDEARELGLGSDAAVAYARAHLGKDAELGNAAACQQVLLTWSARHPFAAACGRSLAYAAAIPAGPVIYCAHRGPGIARWSASISLATLMTGSLLLGLYALMPL
jgi:hypothetical protein